MTEQQRIANLIRKGYAKFGFKFGQRFYYDPDTREACPAFAAFVAEMPADIDLEELEEAEIEDCPNVENSIGQSLNVNPALIKTISNRHNIYIGAINSLESTLELLDNDKLEF